MKFNPVFINATTLGDCWFQLLQGLYDNGRKYLITDGSFKGINRLVFDDVSGFISYPHIRPLAPLMPEASSLPAPTTDEDIEMYFANYLMNNQIQDNEDYKYATFITGGKYNIPKGILYECDDNDSRVFALANKIAVPDQLEWIIKHFEEKGFGNEHCYLTVGYPESNFAYDIPFKTEQERKTSPCLRGLDFRIIEDKVKHCSRQCEYDQILIDRCNIGSACPKCFIGKIRESIKFYLHTKVIYRSWDLWGGWPTNMGGFTLLNEYVANELNIEPGPLSFTCKSLHCYDFQLDVLKMRLGKGDKNV